MNTYLKNQPPARQFVTFLGLAAGFFLLNIALSSFFFQGLSEALTDKTTTISADTIAKFKWAQLFSSTIIFVAPALLFAYFSSPNMLPYVGMQKHFSFTLLIFCVLLLFGVQPFVSWLGSMNAKIHFGSMQKELLQMEELYNRAIQTFLKMNSPLDLVINLFIMALLPAIGEELFFRGALQKVLLRMSEKPWLAILISSVVFALLHGTFFKVLPIFTLGLLLGTVYYFTRNLWYTIIIHFLNNAFAVLSVYYGSKSSFLQKLNDDKLVVPLYAALFSFVVLVTIIYMMKRKSDEVLPAYLTDDNNLTPD
ncbi:MAG: CPBP family intramembrane metalloprotease [Chitinophagaceae bacterium]|nr:CPBP family intramembrane metalloprotease [Chitinophagaceae bacterium]